MKKTQSIISICLCLILLFSVVSSPLRVHAALDPFTLYAVGSIFASFVIAGITGEIAALGPDVVKEITATVQDNKAYMIDLMRDSYEADRSTMTFSQAFMHELAVIIRDSPALLSILGLEADYIEMQLSRVEDQTVVHVPSEELLERPGLITQEQLLTGDYAEALKWNNQLLYDVKLALHDLQFTFAEDNKMLRNDLEYWMGAVNQSTVTFQRSIQQWLGDLNYNTVLYGKSTLEWLGNVNESIGQLYNSFPDWFQSLDLSLSSMKLLLHDDLFSMQKGLLTSLSTLDQGLDTLEKQQTQWLGNVNSTVSKWGKDNVDWLKNLNSNLGYYSGQMLTSFDGLSQKLDQQLEVFPVLQQNLDAQLEIFPQLNQTLDQLQEKIPVLNQDQILEKPQIVVQIHDQKQILVSDYASMGQAFSAKMAWVPQIFDFLSELRSRLNSGTPPKVAINLSAAEGSIDWGGSAYIMDMSWYARYKPFVDTILSGIMWLCFGWAVYKRIPDIISGVGLTMENATQTPGHVWSDRAERSASLQYRADRRQDYYSRRGW